MIKDQGQKKPVAFPHGQLQELCYRVPEQFAFRITGIGRARIGRDQENEPQPVFALRAKAGPVDGAAQPHIFTDQTTFLKNLPLHTGENIFISFHFFFFFFIFS